MHRIRFHYSPNDLLRRLAMQYAVLITPVLGETLSKETFDDLEIARSYYRQLVSSTPYQQVLVLLLEKPSELEENIIDVDYIDGTVKQAYHAGSARPLIH